MQQTTHSADCRIAVGTYELLAFLLLLLAFANKMSIASPFIILSLCFTLAYIFGLFIFITDYEENKCEMTYMFEYPQFVVGIPVFRLESV